MFQLQLYQQKIIKKLSKLLSKGFKKSFYLSECKTKNENKNTTDKYRYFLESMLKDLILKKFIYQKA